MPEKIGTYENHVIVHGTAEPNGDIVSFPLETATVITHVAGYWTELTGLVLFPEPVDIREQVQEWPCT